MNDTKTTIAEMAEIKREIAELKERYGELETELLKQAVSDLRDTKLKTVEYNGRMGVTATATIAESVKVLFPTMLKEAFGEAAYSDITVVKTSTSLTPAAAKVIAAVAEGNIIDTPFDKLISELPTDEEARALMRKKLKGRDYIKDYEVLRAIGGLDHDTAEEYAYFLYEARQYELFLKLVALTGDTSPQRINAVKDAITTAVAVEETAKITLYGV